MVGALSKHTNAFKLTCVLRTDQRILLRLFVFGTTVKQRSSSAYLRFRCCALPHLGTSVDRKLRTTTEPSHQRILGPSIVNLHAQITSIRMRKLRVEVVPVMSQPDASWKGASGYVPPSSVAAPDACAT
eukprot:5276335-Pleurochrysis_carterae.AAC.1